jgi:hypothetical protein
MGESQRLQEILKRDRRPVGKQAVKMKRTQTGNLCQFGQIGLLGMVLAHITDNLSYALVVVHAVILPIADTFSTRFLRNDQN